jgi:hypothetical protein
MKGKREFSEYEANQIRKLINQKVSASKSEQKTIRNKIRGFKFYFSDFSYKKRYTVVDVENLIRTGEIIITDNPNPNYKPAQNIPNNELQKKTTEKVEIGNKNIERELITKGDFKSISDLNQKTLDSTGFYCIRLKNYSKLPYRYQSILDKRKFQFIYIGKAKGQSLRERLGQELEHTKPGTFFRSIGCVLKYFPMKGHLKGNSNQNNFKFSKTNTTKIIEWLKRNVELSISSYEGNFDIEKDLIKKYCPLFNYTHNPLKLQELREDKAKCRKIARE